VYNFIGAWVARKLQDILGDSAYDPTDHKVIEQLKETVDKDLKIDYLITGSWSQKASVEGERLLGPEHVNIATDSRMTNGGKFGTIPDESTWRLSKDPALVYYCANETVDGVEFQDFPQSLQPGPDGKGPIVIADMSSNILTQKIPINNFSAIFFGAQKNLGPAGVTVVVIKKSFLPPVTSQPPSSLMRQLGLPIPPVIFQYEPIAKNNSLYNTLSIFE
jgi:phosphoserine aminotransferase